VIAAVLSLVLAGVALPHLLHLDRVRPATAATMWAAGLTLRALASLSVALYLILVFPEPAAFKLFTHWCQHAGLPLIGLHADVHGHMVGAALLLAPFVAAIGTLALSFWRTARTARSVRTMLERSALGAGPGGSVIVGGPDVAVAAAGLVHPRVVVTAGALAALEDDELAAGLAHEHGHIARRHHLALVYGECCRALAMFLPGTRRAVSELRFQLERDADEWALRRHHDPCALASAICKAATHSPGPIVAALGGGAVERRLDVLMAPPRPRGGLLRRRVLDTGRCSWPASR
jgi:Zn-dependent protease with chaperone function